MSEEAPKVDTPKPPKGPKALIALLLLNLGASGFTTFKVVTAEPAPAATEHAPEPPKTNEISGPVVPLDPFVVNLDEPGQARYLKLTIQIEMIPPEGEKVIEKNKQLIRDTILSHLSGLHLKDTLGSAAKDKLRADLLAKLEAIVGPNQVRRLFFSEFMVQ